jgi:hypothetical protein
VNVAGPDVCCRKTRRRQEAEADPSVHEGVATGVRGGIGRAGRNEQNTRSGAVSKVPEVCRSQRGRFDRAGSLGQVGKRRSRK